ncbi:hypothetical protein [Blastomonas fulva]|uniref:hypothetical protein n=1 Tax=Blastomonas fulva TaxID=1550728 RepID=UPI003F715E01
MNLIADLRIEILETLPHQPEHRAVLEAMHISDLLIIFLNWVNRIPPPRHYTVHRSDALKANPLAQEPSYREPLEHIIDLLASEQEVTPHLSKRIKTGYEPQQSQKNLKRRRDLDLLLNDWGVHHLHLTTIVESDGFVRRSKLLLFAAFLGDNAYLIDIMSHDDWARDAIPEIILRNWPQAGLIHELPSVLGMRHSRTEKDRMQLRNNGMASPIEMDDKVFAFTPGLSTAGTSLRAVRAADQMLDTLKRFKNHLRHHPDYIAVAFQQKGIALPEKLDLHFTFLQSGYGVIEKTSGFLFRFTS